MWKCSGNVNMNIRNIKMQRNGKCERETAKWKCKLEHAKCETAKMWKCNEDVNVDMRNIKLQICGNVVEM